MQTPISGDPTSTGLDGDGLSGVPSRAAGIGQRATAAIDAAIDEKRDAIARGMDSAASALRENADRLPGGDKVVNAALTAADAMQTTADYVRESDLYDVLADLRQIVTKHPGATLVIATALGFLLARGVARAR